MKKVAKVGVGVMIQNDQQEILLGLRHGSHGAGEWSLPGGTIEFGETIAQAAIRETKEETGLDINDLALISLGDELGYIKTDDKHYIVIGLQAKYEGGEVEVMEPEKFIEWKWFDLDNLPAKIFEGTDIIIKNFKDNKIYQPSL